MHPRNKIRLLAGVPMDLALELEHSKNLKEAALQDEAEDDEHSVDVQSVQPDVTSLVGVIAAAKNVIKHLEGQIRQYSDNPSAVKTDKKDLSGYERILSLLLKENADGAKRAYQNLDTEARELIANPQVVSKRSNRKAASSLFGFDLLKEDLEEGIGIDMLLGRKGKRAVRKLLRPDIEKSALTLYQFLRQKGREAHDARHVAASSFGMDDRTFMDILMDAGINESEEIIAEDHFEVGSHVIDKSGKVWEVTAEGVEDEGDAEVYQLKDISSGDTSEDTAGNLRKITKEGEEDIDKEVEEFLTEYNYTGGGAIKSKLLQLYKMNPNAYRELKPTLEEIYHTSGDIEKIDFEIESKMAEVRRAKIGESAHDYKDNYKSFEDDEEKPINVSDGNSNDEQYYDGMERKPESPHQLSEPGDLSDQDNSDYDKDIKMKVPANITSALKKEADKARMEANKLDVRDKNSSYFYRDLARAFDDIRGHLEKGTVYDVKQAQVFAQTLMGPMLHKIPNEVWKWLTNAGKTRSLKDYMKEVGNDAKLKKGFDPTKEKAA